MMNDHQLNTLLLSTRISSASVAETKKEPSICTTDDEYALRDRVYSRGYPIISLIINIATAHTTLGMSGLDTFNDDCKVLSFAYKFTVLKY